MDVFVIGQAVHAPAARIGEKRLEELVFDTAHAALADAGVSRAQIDHVTIAGCDELDGRSISSMLLAAPAGAQLRDEMKCTDSGLTGLCLEAMRIEAGIFHLGLLVSWSKPSTAPLEDVMRMRCEPFYTRPVGLNMAITDGLFAQTAGEAYGFDEFDADEAVLDAYRRADANPRGVGHGVPAIENIATSPYVATPLRQAHQAPITDGAVAMVVASAAWMKRNPNARALAQVAGIGWRNEQYDLGRDRLAGLTGFRATIADAVRMAGLKDAGSLDLLELDSQTGFHELAFRAALNGHAPAAISTSGGAFAQNPYFCTGLINAAEVVLQLSDKAGPIQIPGIKRAAAHGSHGYAQQGNVAVVLERGLMAKNVVAVIGTGQTKFKTHYADKTYVELAQDAAKLVMDDAGVTPDEIDAVVFSMAPTQFMGVNDCDRWATSHVWGTGKPFMRIHAGGATGGSALQAGYVHVASGVYRTVLVVGADRVAETPDAQHILNLIWDRFYEHDFALNTVTMTALAAQRYMARYGTTEEEFAQVVVRGRRNAKGNPYAHLKGDVTVEDVMNSPRVAYPYKRFDICPRSSGAAAVVLSNLDVAKEKCSRPAFVTGASAITHSVFMGDRMGVFSETEFSDHDGEWIAGQEAYRQAGITNPANQIQVAELYDPFSTFQYPIIEGLGFCGRGRASTIDQEGGWDMQGGQVAINPSGGTLCTNPIGVTGLVRIVDAANQIMGKAGENQLKGVHNAVATAAGGSTQFFTVTTLGDDHAPQGRVQ